jgi:hypothetical protein
MSVKYPYSPILFSERMFPALRPNEIDRARDLARLKKFASILNQPSQPKPSPQPQTARKTVVLCDDLIRCPECAIEFAGDDVEQFKAHVFKCRTEHGVDPLLPLQLLRRRPTSTGPASARGGSQNPRNRDVESLLRPVSQGRERIHLFDGYRLPAPPSHPRSAQRPNFEKVANLTSQRLAAHKSGEALLPEAALRSTRSSRGHRRVFHDHSSEDKVGGLSSSGGRLVRSTGTGNSEVQGSRELAPFVGQQSHVALFDRIQTFLANESSSSPNTLDLTELTLLVDHLPVLRSAIGFYRESFRVKLLQATLHEEFRKGFIPLLMKSNYIVDLEIDADLADPFKPVQSKCQVNEKAFRDAAIAAHFQEMVRSYKTQRAEHAEAISALFEEMSQSREEIKKKEKRERAKLGEDLQATIRRTAAMLRRQAIQQFKSSQRQDLEAIETNRRGIIVTARIQELLNLVTKEEAEIRKMILHKRETSRLHDRLVERDAVVEAKQQERNRILSQKKAKQRLEESEEQQRMSIGEKWEASLAVYRKQYLRHRAYLVWIQQQRDDVAGKIQSETTARLEQESLEETGRNALAEKLRRAIEGVQQKYLAQQDALTSLEASRRSEEESAFSDWFTLSMKLFFTETRLIKLWSKTQEREARRLNHLKVLPLLRCQTAVPYSPPLYCMPVVGARPTPAVGLLRGLNLSLEMPAGWEREMQDLLDQSRAAVNEEKAAAHEHIRWLNKNWKRIMEASKTIFSPFNQIDIGDILQITRKEPPPPPAKSPPASPSAKGKGEINPIMLEPVPTGEAAQGKLLGTDYRRWFVAWCDRLSVSKILASKLQVRGGIVECKFSEEAIDDSTPPTQQLGYNGHRMLVPNAETQVLYDNGEPSDEENASQPDQRNLERKTSWVDDFYMSFETSGQYTRNRRKSSGGVVTAAPIVVKVESERHGEESDSSDDDEAGEEGSEASVETAPPKPEPSAKHAIALNIGEPDLEISVPFDTIRSTLAKVAYQNVTAVAPETALASRTQTVKVNLSLCFTLQNAYTDDSQPNQQSVDLLGWEPIKVAPEPLLYAVKLEYPVSVVIAPSVFRLPKNQPFPSCLLIEGQMNDIPLLPPIEGILEPYDFLKSSATEEHETVQDNSGVRVAHQTLGESSSSVGYTDGTLTIEILDPSTPWDRLSLKDEAPTVRCETLERSTFVRSVSVHGSQIAEVTEGALQAARMVTSKNSNNVRPYCVLSIRNPQKKLISAAAILEVINRLRFHNFQSEPEEGERIVRLTLTPSDGRFSSVLEMRYEIEPIDKPTELQITHPKVIFRQPCLTVPANLRSYIEPPLIPVANECRVIDEDTDRFSGGFMKVTLASSQRGDSLVLVPDTSRLYPSHLALDKPTLLDVTDDGLGIVFEGRIVATVIKGTIFKPAVTPSMGEDALSGTVDEATNSTPAGTGDAGATVNNVSISTNADLSSSAELHLEFAQEDMCSITAVQEILRHIALSSTPITNLKTHLASQRTIHFHIQIMDNEQACQMEDEVVIRGGGHSVQLSEKACVIDYKEGQGPIKLGALDISADRINPLTNFCTGYIAVSVVEGFEADSLSLKVDESEFKLVEVGEKPSRIAKLASKHFLDNTSLGVASVSGSPSLTPSLSSAMLTPGSSLSRSSTMSLNPSRTSVANLKDKFRQVAQEVVKTKDEPTSTPTSAFATVVADTLKQTRSYEFVFAGAREALGVVTRIGSGKGLLIRFYKEKKENFVSRKNIVALLRNLTYSCSAVSPDETTKIIKVWVCDSGSSTPSVCVINVNLEVVDDVTEVLLKSPKKRCCQLPDPPAFPLFPYGRAKFVDEDTEFFDGGSITLTAVAGSTKGDVLGLRLPQVQSQPSKGQVPNLTVPQSPFLEIRDGGRSIWNGDIQIATVDTTTHNGGHSEVKINFRPAPAGSERVSIDIASTLLNSLCFGNTLDRVKDPNRSYIIKIRDTSNPVEGKAKISLEVQPPLFVLNLCQPFGSATSFEGQFHQDLWLPPSDPAVKAPPVPPIAVAKNAVVNVERYPAGYFEALLLPGEGGTVGHDSIHQNALKEAGFTINKDNQLMLVKDLVAINVTISKTTFRCEFSAACKMNKGTMQTLIRSIAVAPDPGRKVIQPVTGFSPPPPPGENGSAEVAPPAAATYHVSKTAFVVAFSLSDGNCLVTGSTNFLY